MYNCYGNFPNQVFKKGIPGKPPFSALVKDWISRFMCDTSVRLSIFLHRCLSVLKMYAQLWARSYKTFFMLNSAEHEILNAHKYEKANNCWHFDIYE